MLFARRKTQLTDAASALPGRAQPIATAETHFVNGRPLKGPYPDGAETAIFAFGCYWGAERKFWTLPGVWVTAVGNAGGVTPNPTYEEVCSGMTGHAESVLVVYDPSRISYEQLLQVFFTVAHDPTQLDRQGPDVGTQYRSAVFYRSEAQHQAAERYLAKLRDAKVYPSPIVTEVTPLRGFNRAEDYHQDYLVHHPSQPYIVINDAPKLEELRRRFPELYREG